jgi:hypothetical protein
MHCVTHSEGLAANSACQQAKLILKKNFNIGIDITQSGLRLGLLSKSSRPVPKN